MCDLTLILKELSGSQVGNRSLGARVETGRAVGRLLQLTGLEAVVAGPGCWWGKDRILNIF